MGPGPEQPHEQHLALQVRAPPTHVDTPVSLILLQRFQPNVVVGARALFSSGSAVRPVIRLAANSANFQDPNKPTPMLDFTRHLNGHVPVVDGTNFNQLLRGIDLQIGDGNPGATAVMLPGAQGCSVQDVTITGNRAPVALSFIIVSPPVWCSW